jgi:hypothetical protein
MTSKTTMLRIALGAAALALNATAYPAAASPAPTAPGQGPAFAQRRTTTAAFMYPGQLHEVRGVVRAINGTTLTLQTRTGVLKVDASYAMANYLTAPLFAGRMVVVHAALNQQHVLVAHDIAREHTPPAYWPADR